MVHKSILALLLLLGTGLMEGCAQNGNDATTKEATSPNTENRLANATSPYLQQHADNPVNWYEWGDAAFEKAQRENKLVIVSIGYAACHWCHVMEHKSFMDSAVAELMNKHFVSVKVDREERPDVDDTYMMACRLISGSGGWPLNAITLPNRDPIFAGTYFPKDKWMELLNKIQRVYERNPQRLRKQAEQLTQGIKQNSVIQPAASARDFTMDDLHSYFQNDLVKNIDWEIDYDGQKGNNKFPNPTNFTFQLHYYYLTGNKKALDAVTTTLDHMARGGIYDQIGGGFSRYSTDQMWKVPHFEKMLYDNSQLVSLYAKAYKATGKELYKNVVTETLEFIDRVMTSPEGGFYSSLNADSEGEEGKYYVWRAREIEEVLNENEELVMDFYNVTASGNWEHGKNVLFRDQSVEDFAREHNLEVSKVREIIDEADRKLLEARQPRTMPSKDTKVLTSWNALMLQGYIDAYQALGRKEYLDKALQNGHFLKDHVVQEDYSIMRSYKDGRANIQGFLDDYSYTISAFIDLYEVTHDKMWLEEARKLSEYVIDNFFDPGSGLFFFKSKQSEALIANNRDLTDNTMPSGNSVMAKALFKLSKYYYDKHKGYKDTARQMLSTAHQRIEQAPAVFGNWLSLMSYYAKPPFEVAVIGEDHLPKTHDLQSRYLPHSIFMGSKREENLSLLEKRFIEGQTTIYVCRNRVCQLPVTEVKKALEQMEEQL